MSRGIRPEPCVLFAHGERFGKLTVLARVQTKKPCGPRFRCGCECGARRVVKGSKLRKGEVTACLKCSIPAFDRKVSL